MPLSQLIIAFLITAATMSIAIGLRIQRSRRSLAVSNVFLEGFDTTLPNQGLRQAELSRPGSERILKPTLQRLAGIGNMLTPKRNIEQIQRDLIMAGLAGQLQVADFIGMRVLFAALLAAATFFFMALNRPVSSAVLMTFSGFLVGLYLPNIWLRGRVSKRQKAIQRVLPDALDMMSICVDAGLGFEAAIQKVAFQWDNELTLEFRRMVSEIRVGVSRGDALRHLVDRTGVSDVASFVAVLIQADNLGIAIRDVLHSQAVQMRIRRRQRAEEAARKAPLKMLFPMVFFIFPAMFAVILGPAVPRLMNMF